MPVKVTCSDGGSVTATLSGEVDHHGAREMMKLLDETIDEYLPRRLTLDLSGITFMDSSGIAVLIRALRKMEQLGGTLTAVSIPPQPRKVLDAAGAGRLIKFE